MSDSCQRQRTGFHSLIGSPHVVGCCASIRGRWSTLVQLPLRRRVINDIASALNSSVKTGQDMPTDSVSTPRTTIKSLPIELITTIFVIGSELDDPYVDSPFLLKTNRDYKPAPTSNFQVLVSQVCQGWRKIAENTPALWTTLHFRHPSHIPRAKTFLSRSGPVRLFNIFVDTVAKKDHREGSTLYNDELDEIFQIIVPHIQRWRAFHLKISDNKCKGTARHYLSSCGTAPKLETLQLYHFENYGTSQQLHLATYRPPVIIFSNDLPKLKNVSLIGVNLGWDNSPFLSNLENLELALHSQSVRPDYKYWSKILQSSPEMKTLSLHYSGPKGSTGDSSQIWPSNENKIRLQSLRELNLTDLDPGYLCDLMERLQLPALGKLTIDLPDQNYTPFIMLLVGPPKQPTAFIRSSSSADLSYLNASQNFPTSNPPISSLGNLQALTIRALSCTLSSWATLLQALKGMRAFEVDFSCVGDGFWTIFTQDGEYLFNTPTKSTTGKKQVNLVLPLLERFRFSGISGPEIIGALDYRHRHRTGPEIPMQEWTIGWNDQRRKKDSEMDGLIARGFWVPEDGSEKGKVVIKNYQDDEEFEDSDGENSDEEDDGEDIEGSDISDHVS